MGGAAADLAHLVEPEGRPGLPSTLAVDELAMGAVAVASLAVAELAGRRRGTTMTPVRIDPHRVAASLASDRHFRLDGRSFSPWAELSGFHRAADRWVRVHANYPHHADRLRRLLRLDMTAGRVEVGAAIASWPALELEAAAADAGAVVLTVRTPQEWGAHPQGQAAVAADLVSLESLGDAAPRHPVSSASPDARPLAGLRVLDLTRVIAGPMAGRTLAQAGADVLRVDPTHLPEPEWFHLDSGTGKRSTRLDLRAAGDRRVLRGLLAEADVVLTGYRPGSLDRYGLSWAALAERRPGAVLGSVAAWTEAGPWWRRRGFDSVVQAASGIAALEGDGDRPGALPVQALDHVAGQLLAAGILRALGEQHRDGGTRGVRVTLDRVAHALVQLPVRSTTSGVDAVPGPPRLVRGLSGGRAVVCAAPAVVVPGAPDGWPAMATPLGSDLPAWRPR